MKGKDLLLSYASFLVLQCVLEARFIYRVIAEHQSLSVWNRVFMVVLIIGIILNVLSIRKYLKERKSEVVSN